MSKTMKIGELAKSTGLTVRSLHHYDEIGLLKPSARTDAGHRLYSRADIKRLQTIISLQCLHLSLKEIKQTLNEDIHAFEHALERHIKCLESDIKQKKVLYERLSELQLRLKAKNEVEVEEIVKNIEVIVMYEKYYSQEQLEKLKQREAQLSESEKEQIHEKWMTLFDKLKEAHKLGLDVTEPTVLELGRQANKYVGAFTGGDPSIQASHQNMYSTEGGSNVLKQHGVDMSQEVFEYMAKAMEAAKAD
jgi:DNA-binding transcriptional MerR regulator